jgi:hypothetical protein
MKSCRESVRSGLNRYEIALSSGLKARCTGIVNPGSGKWATSSAVTAGGDVFFFMDPLLSGRLALRANTLQQAAIV